MIDNDDLLIENLDGVLHVTINRPERRNALSNSVVEGLEQVIAYIHDNPAEVRALVLRGAGGIFCAGGDLKDFKSIFQEGGADRAAVAASNRRGGALFTALDRLPVVVIAAVEKAAMGGGVGLAAVADVTIATADTTFSLTETTLGIPPAQISPFIVARVGSHHARVLMLTAARIDAAEAFRIGMVDKVVADGAALDVAIKDLVANVRRCAPGANGVSKELVHAAASTPLDELLDTAAGCFADALLGDEARDGVGAFLSKSKPSWAK
ncbi:enoyl-CoA hydratase/isomerase family protein [Mycolicibacterium llatzerense]|uniref:enoyl-CoA hydratase/isomerase family protein n=1 Tax=Mycolicibacterium llatzerense TaxID=280871 RepID=UPI0021B67331|nr:enoyl-CoA hydratase-related protein [Mycolicibacterium llatzerense]MCT7366059.1 hypothetical protein [Mycolicibacterium llatzerense]